MADIQMVCRFVEQKFLRLLCQGPRNQDSLSLAAGQRGPWLGGTVDHVRALQRRGHGIFVTS